LTFIRVEVKFRIIALYNLNSTYGCLLEVGESWGDFELVYVFHWSQWSCFGPEFEVVAVGLSYIAFKFVFRHLV